MNIKTHRVIYSRDYIWLNKNWGQYHNITDIEIYYENKDDELADDWDNISKSTIESTNANFDKNQQISSSDSSSSSDDQYDDYNFITDSENESYGKYNAFNFDNEAADHVIFSPSPHKSKGGNQNSKDRNNTVHTGTRQFLKTQKTTLIENPIKLFSKQSKLPSTKLSRAQKKLASSETFWNVPIVPSGIGNNPKINYVRVGKRNSKLKNSIYDHIRNDVLLAAKLNKGGTGGTEPTTFEGAWYHHDKDKQQKWQTAIRKEFNDMTTKEVWIKKQSHEIPNDRKPIGSKWVFKEKKDGTHRSRLVGLGYSQIPGVDYSENYAPVINDVTYRILLLILLIFNFESRVVDVETAFLYGKLEETIFMKIPKGYREVIGNDQEGDVLELQKSLYGLVQAARQWWKNLTEYMTIEKGFIKSEVDPCLLIREDEYGIVYLGLYVDDILMVGTQQAINEAVKDLKNKYAIKDLGTIKEYVGVTISKEKGELSLNQPDIINKLESKFFNEIKDLKVYDTPAGMQDKIIRPEESSVLLSYEDQKNFRSGVGSLLYLVKHSRPDVANAVRNLSKVMDGATAAHQKILHRAIKYICDTRDRSLFLRPVNIKGRFWDIEAFCDSDWAAMENNRKSVTGFVVYVNGALVSWKSKQQEVTAKSSTEAEYIAMASVCTEVLFIKQLLESINIGVKTPIKINIDNTGAIMLLENESISHRTKHIDVRTHFMRDLKEDNIIKVEYINTKFNHADPYTKNVVGNDYH
jgi:Reverse transcriptase (RNA-dependent DNA polymerase)